MKEFERILHIRSLLWIAFTAGILCVCHGDLSYSVPEEMKKGTVFGNIAKDLGLTVKDLSDRKARIDMENEDKRFFDHQGGQLTTRNAFSQKMLEAGLPFGAEMKQSTIEKTKLKEILEKLHPPSQKLWAKQFSHLGFSHLESVVALRFGDILNTYMVF